MSKAWLPSEILRLRIAACGRTYRQMAAKTGLNLPTLWRFINNQGGLRMSNVDRLFELFGLRVVEVRPRNRKKAKP